MLPPIAPKKTSAHPRFVLAKYHADKCYYPAIILQKQSTTKSGHRLLKHVDATEGVVVPNGEIFEVTDVLKIGRKVLVKTTPVHYEDGVIIRVMDEGVDRQSRYVVRLDYDGGEKVVEVDKLGLTEEEFRKGAHEFQPLECVSNDSDFDDHEPSTSEESSSESDSRSDNYSPRMKERKRRQKRRVSARVRAIKEQKKSVESDAIMLLDPISQAAIDDMAIVYCVGECTFHRGEEVFKQWDDTHWYSAKVTGSEHDKIRVQWCEGGNVELVDGDSLLRAREVLQSGMAVHIVISGQTFYQQVAFVEYKGHGGRHVMKNEFGDLIWKTFAAMRCVVEDQKLRKPPVTKPTVAQKRAPVALKNLPSEPVAQKRERAIDSSDTNSPDREPQTPLRRVKSFKLRLAALPAKPIPKPVSIEISPKMLENFAFIITSGQSDDTTFDRYNIVKTLQRLGGTVYRSFVDMEKSARKENRFLLAPTYCRTKKFFQGLASDVPCVSHKWIEGMATKGKKLDFSPYRLPAGKSLMTSKILPWTPRRTLLDDWVVGVYGSDRFWDEWSVTLVAGRAKPIHLHEQNTNGNTIGQLNIIIVENVATQQLVDISLAKCVQMVTLEWLFQTLIYGHIKSETYWPYMHPSGLVGDVSMSA
ncbi:hypothetical protein BV898_09638 [Hypsibius exemplaris]|uniref:BRCT domain-containing protein n=1 Tax=Hypsibius exemplaris TaxID=2072580 RepID=A0A1W0WLS9_HYPEX|nr:hypothetical protein BV898_09638 [Hypsibius exemplaris]